MHFNNGKIPATRSWPSKEFIVFLIIWAKPYRVDISFWQYPDIKYLKTKPERQGTKHLASLVFVLTSQPHPYSKTAFEKVGVRIMSIWWRRGESNPRLYHPITIDITNFYRRLCVNSCVKVHRMLGQSGRHTHPPWTSWYANTPS